MVPSQFHNTLLSECCRFTMINASQLYRRSLQLGGYSLRVRIREYSQKILEGHRDDDRGGGAGDDD